MRACISSRQTDISIMHRVPVIIKCFNVCKPIIMGVHMGFSYFHHWMRGGGGGYPSILILGGFKKIVPCAVQLKKNKGRLFVSLVS